MKANLLCYLFGHTGNLTESGYPLCSRCGAHSYWNSRHIDPETPIDWDRAGMLLRPYWAVRNSVERALARRQWKRDEDDLPF